MPDSATTRRSARPAATVIVVRDTPRGPELFMVRRHDGQAFMAGAHVFPGGRVDATDRASADASWCEGLESAGIASLSEAAAVAHRLGAIRELFEEAGVLLAYDRPGHLVDLTGSSIRERFEGYRREIHAGTLGLPALAAREALHIALDTLTPFARWITPPVDVRQFDAWFFLARMPPSQQATHDAIESTEGIWLTPADALSRALAGTMTLPPPTWTTLRELEPFGTVDAAMAAARRRRFEPRQPALYEVGDARFLLLPGDPLNAEGWPEPVPIETRFRLVGTRWVAERARP